MRRALRRLRCALGFHYWTHGWRFVSPKHPRYRYEVACLWCDKVAKVTP